MVKNRRIILIFDEFFKLLMKLEGGYSDNPNDKGGKTKYGITENTLNAYNSRYNKSYKIDQLKEDEAKEIYKNEYFSKIYPVAIRPVYYHYFDISVNNGYGDYIRCREDCKDDIRKLIKWRKEKYKNIVNKNPSQDVFLKGWFNRINRINEYFNIKVV